MPRGTEVTWPHGLQGARGHSRDVETAGMDADKDCSCNTAVLSVQLEWLPWAWQSSCASPKGDEHEYALMSGRVGACQTSLTGTARVRVGPCVTWGCHLQGGGLRRDEVLCPCPLRDQLGQLLLQVHICLLQLCAMLKGCHLRCRLHIKLQQV